MLQILLTIGDFRGIFFNIADNSLLSGLRIQGPHVTTYVTGNGNISRVGNANLNGDGNAHSFDVGVEIGQNGLKGGKDDIQSTTFTLFHTSQSLDLSLFAQQDFGVRITSVGAQGGSREGSSKLIGTSPVLPPVTIQPSPTPVPAPAPAPAPTPAPAPEPPVSSEPPPIVIHPPATPGPVPDSSASPNPTEIPEPSAVAALTIAGVGAFKFLKRRDQETTMPLPQKPPHC